VPPVPRVHQRPHHPTALEDVGRLDDPLVDDGLDPEELDERLRGLARALQRRDDERRERPIEAPDELGGLAGHAPPVCAQPEARETPVEHAAGVVDLSVAHEMEAIGGHPTSLRWRVLWGG